MTDYTRLRYIYSLHACSICTLLTFLSYCIRKRVNEIFIIKILDYIYNNASHKTVKYNG